MPARKWYPRMPIASEAVIRQPATNEAWMTRRRYRDRGASGSCLRSKFNMGGSRHQHQLAEVLAGLDATVRIGGSRERHRRVQHGREPPVAHEAQDLDHLGPPA